MPIKIVVDSACDVPAQIAEELDITIVPVYINIGDQSYLEGVELSRQEFYENLSTYPTYPTTAAPASGSFTENYQKLQKKMLSRSKEYFQTFLVAYTPNFTGLSSQLMPSDKR